MIWESKFLYFLQTNVRSDIIDKIMILVSTLADRGLIFIALSIFMLFMPNMARISYMSLTSLTFNGLITNVILKPLIARTRPFEKYDLITSVLAKLPQDYSFPSGHTSASFAFATSVFLYNRQLGILAYIYAFLVAFSRMYIGVHYPTDIIVGMIIGVAVSVLCNKYAIVIYKKISEFI